MFYIKRLMLRAIDPEADTKVLTQWLNDTNYLQAISLSPPLPSSNAGVKKFLEKIEKREGHMPCFAICEMPEASEAPSSLAVDDNYFVKDGKPRYPLIGLLSIGSPDELHYSTRIGRFGIALDRAHQGM